MKRKLVVLINDKAPYDQYVNLLKMKYDVELVKNSTFEKKGEIPPIDLILFTGGEDVDPSYYGDKMGQFTSTNVERDQIESNMFKKVNYNVPKLGICRGSQFLTVMNRGRLIQHVENHGIGGTHAITFNHLHEGKRMPMTSTHHQMMYPFDLPEKDYILCAHSTKHLSSKYWNGYNKNIEIKDDFLEPEIVFYPRSNSLAIQGHPESGIMTDSDKEFILNYIAVILKI